jgi:hypothetical protein
MENQELLKAIAALADKVNSLEDNFHKHNSNCQCNSSPPTAGRPLTEEEKLFVQQNLARQAMGSIQDS